MADSQPKRARVSNIIPFGAPGQGSPLDKLADERSEKALIGCVFFQPDLYPALSDIVQATDFTSLRRGFIWWAFEQVYPAIDTHTVMRALLAHKEHVNSKPDELAHELDAYLLDVPDVNHAERYAYMVKDAATRIRIFNSGGAQQQRVLEGGDLNDIIDACNQLLFIASNQHNGRYQTTAQYIASQHIDRYEDILAGRWSPILPTGYHNLDRVTGGLGVGEVTVLAGASGMGKTTFALNIVLNICKRGQRVVIFSLEMSQAEVFDAMLSIHTGIPLVNIKMKKFYNADEMNRYIGAIGELSTYRFDVIDEFPALTPAQLRRKLRVLEAEGGPIALCMVDGLWLMEPTEPGEKEYVNIQRIMRDLTDIASARQFLLPILLLHQYTSDAKERKDKSPQISDMAGGRAVDRTAQNIWGLYSDSYYQIDDPLEMTKLYLMKNRNSGVRNEVVNFLFRNRRYVEA